MWAKQSEVQLLNLKSVGDEMKDGEEISAVPKDLGSSEVYA